AASEIVQVLVEKSLDAKDSKTYGLFKQLMDWCSKVSRMQVRTNADTPEQTANAIAFGATGIGLCRTEHMFFEGQRIDAMREMILADTVAERKKALAKLLPYQREDYVGIKKELDLQVDVVHRVAKEVMAEKKAKLNYMVGTMIEVPRGALTSDEIAQTAEFFSFGTNDLTQMSLGMSRDDSGSFLPAYA